MNWFKLVGLCIILYMAIEIIKAQMNKFKPVIVRVVSMIILIAGSIALGYGVPIIETLKYSIVYNAVLYFVVEYFMYLFLYNELKISVKKFILNKLESGK